MLKRFSSDFLGFVDVIGLILALAFPKVTKIASLLVFFLGFRCVNTSLNEDMSVNHSVKLSKNAFKWGKIVENNFTFL